MRRHVVVIPGFFLQLILEVNEDLLDPFPGPIALSPGRTRNLEST